MFPSLRYQARKTQSQNRKLSEDTCIYEKFTFLAQCLGRVQFRNVTEPSFLFLYRFFHVDHIHTFFFRLDMGLMVAILLVEGDHACILKHRTQIPLSNG